MRKNTLLVLVVMLMLIGVLGILGFLELSAPAGAPPESSDGTDYLSIRKKAYCSSDPGDVRLSKNPPYYVGEKYYWWIEIKVCAKANLSDVVVYDSFGAELMVEGVSYVPIEKPGPYNYTVDYAAGYELGADVSVGNGTYVWVGSLDEDGVAFDEFALSWSSDSLTASFEWTVGSMDEGDVKVIYVTVSTDVNPAGLQEYTSDGIYTLNSGATAKSIVESTGKHVSVESNSLEIQVLEKVD